ncbi:hypothetical protein PSTG_13754 [Puccinia striiformis f. sp. tritici PST-78]|uniref:Uncharacterized protein n=1 Tax=Puccinia striiformis f. sp. tritici PST-78 TaxID=1165861 RepID=A0A0L0V0N7_9BASI|nr:hypothetical protein PSTG_13754 [Puccinia striiformis f. sp. tritici PST-78]
MNFVILPMIFFLTVIHPKTGLAIDSARLSTTKQIRPGARAAAQLECKPLAGLQALKDKSLYLTLNINPESLIPMNQTIRRSEMLAASMAQKQNDVRLFFFFPVPAIFKHVTRGTDEEMLTMDIRISHFLTRVQPSGLLGSWSKF